MIWSISFLLTFSFIAFVSGTTTNQHHIPKRFRHGPRRTESSDDAPGHLAARNASEFGSSYKLTDIWHGSNFFDGWDFFNHPDPTHGLVNYVDQPTAFANDLAYVDQSGVAHMKVDSTADLTIGVKRNSVRISTEKVYNGGLFVLDALKFPYGCAVWPAWWMVGPNWPNNGEIDIFEGVNLNTVNQYTAHTAAGCQINPSPSSPDFAVSPSSAELGRTDCGPTSNNAGCYFIDKKQGTYGPQLNEEGGAVLVMQWEEAGIRIWDFPRSCVPIDLTLGRPDPDFWPEEFLKGAWEGTTCPMDTHFKDMSIVFDITLCGDWAGNVYSQSGCPGNCTTQVMTGSNFVDAEWAVNYVGVYNR